MKLPQHGRRTDERRKGQTTQRVANLGEAERFVCAKPPGGIFVLKTGKSVGTISPPGAVRIAVVC